ncbi:integrase, catalytic region, zinc finger, CCHC-type containing protein [Tanacetum coccineum]|uniref:Integrase, catalytic region, zinc finger, CCHC-type containing protein n=1 Tax=Tanacetum coccineum TaxID=301880 RepID=A0ABQ5GQ49_9ASTR
MSTSKTYQQSLADAGSETRPPMLERGSYIPWASRFRRYINRKRENRKWLNKALDEGPYQFEMFIPNNSTVPKLQTAEDLQGDALLHYDAEMELMNLILLSIPNDIYNSVDACTSAKDMWKRVERLMRGTIQNKVDRETRFTNEFDQFVAEPGEELVFVYISFAQLMNDLERNDMHFPIQFEKLVNVSRAKKLEKSHDPLALVAHTSVVDYVTHPMSVVDYEDEYQQDDVHTNSEDPLAYAMLLLPQAITQKFSTPTNNRLRTSSNTRNQAIIQGDRVNIQSRNSGNTLTIQCYNCNGKGHYARNCPEPRVRDSKYFMEQMLLAKKDEAGVILTNEQNDFLFDDASRMEEIEELSANICLMARIQPVDNTSDVEPSYDSAFINVKDYKRQNEELQKTHSILKRQMSENEDRYHDTVLDLEIKLKKNVDLVLKLGNSLQGMFMHGPKPLSVYDQQLKHGLRYLNPYTLRQAVFQCPKLYLASSLGNSEISLHVRDTEDTLDDASRKLSAEQKYFPSSFIPSDKNSNATLSIPASMPNQLKPIVNELQFYFELFKTLFQRDVKEMKDVFESTKSELCELEKQNDFLKDQILEVSLKYEVELSVLLNHECVDNSLHAEIE